MGTNEFLPGFHCCSHMRRVDIVVRERGEKQIFAEKGNVLLHSSNPTKFFKKKLVKSLFSCRRSFPRLVCAPAVTGVMSASPDSNTRRIRGAWESTRRALVRDRGQGQKRICGSLERSGRRSEPSPMLLSSIRFPRTQVASVVHVAIFQQQETGRTVLRNLRRDGFGRSGVAACFGQRKTAREWRVGR